MPDRTIRQLDTLTYHLERKPRSRYMRIVIQRETVIVRAPVSTPLYEIERFVQDKRAWIANHLRESAHKIDPAKDLGISGSYHTHRARALRVIRDRVSTLASAHGYHVSGVTVRNTAAQWGSCNSHGKLSFSYKLLFLPDDLRDYVIVHELAHTRHMHHGKRFWDEVASVLPEYRRHERALKTYTL